MKRIIETEDIEKAIEKLRCYQKEGIAMGEGYNQGAIDTFNWILKFSEKLRDGDKA